MANKNSRESFVEKAISVHGNKYDYSKVSYINNRTKVCIICPVHGEFWQTPNSHVNSKCGCNKCAIDRKANKLKKKQDDFVAQANIVHNCKYDYSSVDYITTHIPVIIKCPEHGEFLQTPASHLQGCGCSQCSGNKQYDANSFINAANLVHNYKYKYLYNYHNCREKIQIICPEHGQFEQLPSSHLRGAGCPMCAIRDKAIKLKLTNEKFIEKAKIIHGEFYDYSLVEYIDEHTPVKIICPKHGQFEQAPSSHLSGCGCKKCKLKSQTKLYNKLKNVFPNLQFVFEATNKHIPWASKYRFDIYNQQYNFVVEYDGELHFISKDIFGGDQQLIRRQKSDREKDLLCEKNNCSMFRIKYDYTEEDFEELVNKIKLILKQH